MVVLNSLDLKLTHTFDMAHSRMLLAFLSTVNEDLSSNVTMLLYKNPSFTCICMISTRLKQRAELIEFQIQEIEIHCLSI